MIGDSSSNFSNHDLDFDFSQTFQKSRRITSNKYIPEAVFMAYMEYLILYKDSNFPQSILLSKIPKVDIKTIIETKNSKALQDCILNPKFQASISSITNHDKFEDLRSKLTRISQELNIQIVKISSSGLVIYGSSSFKVYILNDECENYIFYPKPWLADVVFDGLNESWQWKMSRTEIKCFCSYNYRHCYCRSCDEYYGDLGIKNLGFEAEKSYDDDGEFPHQNSAMFAKEACFDSSCVNKPIYKCECGDHSIFMCEIHQPIHSSIKNSKGHVIENLKLIQRKQTLSTKAIKYIQDLEASKLKVIKDTASTMKSFENSCNFLLNNIDQVIEKTKKIIEFIARIDEELYFSGRLTDVTSLEFTKFIGKWKCSDREIKLSRSHIEEMYSMSFFVPETSEFMFKPKTSSFYNQIVEPASPLPIIDLDLPSILHDVEKSDKYSFAYDLSLPSILHDVEKPDKSSFANEPLRTYASVNEKSSYVSGNPNPKFEMNKTGQKSRKIIPSNMKSYLDPKTVNGLHSSMLSKELRTEPEKSKKTYAYM